MSVPQGEVLTPEQDQSFINDGFVKVDDAFSRDLARDCRSALRADMGLAPDRPETWTEPVVRIDSKSSPPFVAAANTPRLPAACDTLVGEGRWLAPQGRGTFPIRFPSNERPGDDGWHVEMSFGTENPDVIEWRAVARASTVRTRGGDSRPFAVGGQGFTGGATAPADPREAESRHETP